jgi:hypothetical protein
MSKRRRTQAITLGLVLAAAGACGVSGRDDSLQVPSSSGPMPNVTVHTGAPQPRPVHRRTHRPHARKLGAPTALLRLKRAGLVQPIPASSSTYSRSAYGASLSSADPDRNGCATREDVMARDLVAKTVTGVCNVVKGTLHDPYTGRDVAYDESVYSGSVQIDHILALSLAWRSGAEQWDKAKRVQFANDQRLNLLAVDGRANAGKGDSGPDEWLPVNAAYRCTYARKWTQVAYTYRLHVTPAAYDSLALLLEHCKAGTP